MEFGRVAAAALEKIDFRLCADPAINRQVLTGTAHPNPKMYIGAPRFGTKDWLGKIFPANAKEKDYLSHYVRQFNCIEFNATHYKIFSPQQIVNWTAKAQGKSFLFCPKFLQEITHQGRLTQHAQLTAQFLNSVSHFHPHLGPVFIQLGDSFSPDRQAELFQFLAQLPKSFTFFLELRHADWFTPINSAILFSYLHEQGIGAVITDTPGRRDCAHMHLTVPKLMVRFVGNGLHQTDYTRIDEWIDRMHYWLCNGLEEVFFFMHMPDDATVPEITTYLVEQLNALGDFKLQAPVFIPQPPQQSSLF